MEIKAQSLYGKQNITLIDLGSDKLKSITFNISNLAEIEIIAHTEVLSAGIKAGAAVNIEKAKASIMKIIEDTERMIDEQVEDVFVIISDRGIVGRKYKAQLDINDKKITYPDIELLKKQITDKINAPVIHMIQQGCTIDGVQDVTDPVGMYGRSLSAVFYVVTGVRALLLNLENLISQCQVNFAGCAFASYVSCYASLSNDERDIGSLLIDMGSMATTLAVFKSSKAEVITSIPVGSMSISKDLAFGLNIGVSAAEKLKQEYSHIILDRNSEGIRVSLSQFADGILHKEVNIRDIADMVVPRIEEIFELAYEKVKDANFSAIVLTGGGSKIANIKKIAERIFKKNVRVQEDIRIQNTFFGPEYSALIGMASMMKSMHKERSQIRQTTGYIKRLIGAVAHRMG